MGPDRVRARATARTTVSDCAAVYTYLNGQSKDAEQLRVVAAMVGRGRAVEAERVQRRRAPHVGPEQVLLRAGQAEAWRSSRRCRSPRTRPSTACCRRRARQQDRRRLPARAGRPGQAGGRRRSGPTRCTGYTLRPLYSWGINYYVVNFQSTTGNAADHQAAVLPPGDGVPDEPGRGDPAARCSGYGEPTVGPVPNKPVTTFLSPQGQQATRSRSTRPRPRRLLTSHGWKVVPNGVTTCTEPEPVRPGHQGGPGPELQLPVRDRGGLDHVGDDPAAVQRGRGRASG